jgi:hypothetical protein
MLDHVADMEGKLAKEERTPIEESTTSVANFAVKVFFATDHH